MLAYKMLLLKGKKQNKRKQKILIFKKKYLFKSGYFLLQKYLPGHSLPSQDCLSRTKIIKIKK